MTFDANERATLAGLADVLIPAGDGRISASEAQVGGEWLDKVLEVRPDLAKELKRVLQLGCRRPPEIEVAELQANDSAGFGSLTEVVAGAYFMNPRVRAALGYEGQTARPIDPAPSYQEDGLLQSVIDRGPIYRPSAKGNDP